MTDPTIIYTHTDEAPALATYSLLPVVRAYASKAGVNVETRDISLAGRIIASFPERLEARPAHRRRARRARRAGQDARSQHHQAAQHLGLHPAAQGGHRRAAAAGLRAARLSGRPEVRRGPRRAARATTGSRAAPSTRCCARATPTVARPPRSRTTRGRTRIAWARGRPTRRPTSRTWPRDDFRSTEQSAVIDTAGSLRIELAGEDGSTTRPARVGAGPRRRGRGRVGHARRGAARVSGGTGRAGQGRGRAVLGAPQGDDDEGLRPDHLRPRGARLLPEDVRPATARCSTRPA